MSKKVFVLVAAATLALTGIVAAQEMAAQENAVPAVQQEAQPVAQQPTQAAVVVGNKHCPVCGMVIPAADLGENTAEYQGKVFNVCSPADKDAFLANPEKFAKIAEDEVAKPVEGAEPTQAVEPAAEVK